MKKNFSRNESVLSYLRKWLVGEEIVCIRFELMAPRTELITTFKCTTICIATKAFASLCNKQGTVLRFVYDISVLSGSVLSQIWLEVLTFFRNSLKYYSDNFVQFYFHKVCVSCFVELESAGVEYDGLYLTRFCCYRCVVKQWRSQNPLEGFSSLPWLVV